MKKGMPRTEEGEKSMTVWGERSDVEVYWKQI